MTKPRLLVRTKQEQRGQCTLLKEDQLRLISVGCGRLIPALALPCRVCRLARAGGILPSDRWQSPVWANEPATGRPQSLVGRTNPTGRSVAVRQANATAGPSLSRQTGSGTSARSGPNEPKIPNKTTSRARSCGSGNESPHTSLRYYGQTNRRGRPVAGWAEMSDWAERTQSRGTHDACHLLPLGSIRRTRLSVENSPVFFLLFTGKSIFALAAVVPVLSLRKDQSVAKAAGRKRTRGAEPTLTPGCFGRTNPRRQPKSAFGQTIPRGSPVTPVAKQTQGAPSHDFGQTNPSGRPVRAFAKRTRGQPSPLLRKTNPRCSPVPV